MLSWCEREGRWHGLCPNQEDYKVNNRAFSFLSLKKVAPVSFYFITCNVFQTVLFIQLKLF